MRCFPRLFFSFAALLILATYSSAAPCGAPVVNPDADLLTGRINVGPDGRNFTVFGASGFSTTYTDNTFTGPSFVQGNIGVGPNGKFSWSDGTIDGDVYMYGSGGFTMSGPAHFTAGHMVKYNQSGALSPAFTDYQNLSAAAASDPCTNNYTVNGSPTILTSVNITNVSQSMSLAPIGGSNQKIVLNLSNFVMSSGTFTLTGTTMTTYIINVAKNFSLNNAKILLGDMFGNIYNGASPNPSYAGVMPSNVLFNIRGTGIQISLNQGTQMSGILLALGDKISLSGGKVYGKAIGGQVNITSGGQVISR